MYHTFGEMWQGWTKNLYLLYGGKRARMLGSCITLGPGCFSGIGFYGGCPRWPDRTSMGRMLLRRSLFCGAGAPVELRAGLARMGFDRLADYQPLGAALLGALMLIHCAPTAPRAASNGKGGITPRKERDDLRYASSGVFRIALLSQSELYSGRESAIFGKCNNPRARPQLCCGGHGERRNQPRYWHGAGPQGIEGSFWSRK